jgi:hypothetical protein
MIAIRYKDFSPAPSEEFASRWQFEFSRDGTRWQPFKEYPHHFDISARYYRIRYWEQNGKEFVTEPSTNLSAIG